MSESSQQPSRRLSAIAGALGLVVGIAIGAGGFALLNGSDDSASKADPRPSQTTKAPDPAVTPTGVQTDSSGAAVPNVGDKALKVGETRHGTKIDTTVLAVKNDYRDGNYRAPDGGERWVGVEAKTCITHKLDEENEISWSDFEGGNSDGESFPASGDSWSDFPSPQYPVDTDLQTGCRKGWLLIPVPKAAKVDRIRLGSSAEWVL